MAEISDKKKLKKKQKNRSQERVYDSNGYRIRADCVCFRDTAKNEVLLVSSRNSEGCWTIPGGGFEPNEQGEAAALREANEEAGVNGVIDKHLGTFYDNDRKTKTEAFSIIVSREDCTWEDGRDESFPNGGRERRWFSISEAIDILVKRGKDSKIVYFTRANCLQQQQSGHTTQINQSNDSHEVISDSSSSSSVCSPNIKEEQSCFFEV